MILTINCGSSTIKYQLYTTDVRQVVAKGIVSRIGEDGSYVEHQAGGRKVRHELPVRNHHAAFEVAIQYLLHPQHGAIHDINQIEAVGHRAVHGADIFIESTLITDEVIDKLEECTPLAPLHNPPNLIGIREGRALLPKVPHVAVFDTSFHQTMPPRAYIYALPYEYYLKHKIRKYGFHGTSCRYVSQRAAEVLGRPIDKLKMVICHLGNGVTMAAVQGGHSVDTSIGFATFSGIMMGTRSGDIDPGLIFYLHRALGMSPDAIENLLYKESGLLGVSGVSNDMRVVLEHARAGNVRCQLAAEIFAYMTKKYIGAYAAAMGGIDALVFTAGIGENSAVVREMVCDGLEFLGIEVDPKRNAEAVGKEIAIGKLKARTAVLVVPTDEEKMIALDTMRLARLGER
jgi:acetate kinase